jgi:hypothetical protein
MNCERVYGEGNTLSMCLVTDPLHHDKGNDGLAVTEACIDGDIHKIGMNWDVCWPGTVKCSSRL